jgi:hypothetical protein
MNLKYSFKKPGDTLENLVKTLTNNKRDVCLVRGVTNDVG